MRQGVGGNHVVAGVAEGEGAGISVVVERLGGEGRGRGLGRV